MDEIDNEPVLVDLIDDDDFVQVAPEDFDADPNVIQLDDDDIPDVENAENVEILENDEIPENGVENEAEISAEAQEEEEENPFADDEDSDEEGGGVQVTIRKIEPTEKPAARQGKLDLDATAMINDKPIYDLDLAQMEDRPWRKPGADITDYFNYGFTEETWNLYCERQKKLRAEFSGNQQAANNALFSAIKISNPLANPVINSSSSVVKVLTDNGGRFKQPAHHQSGPMQSPSIQNEQIIRTVISGNSQPTPSLMDFTRPPPGMSMPPPMGLPAPMSSMPPASIADPIFSDAPPGVDGSSDLPPGVESAPGASAPSLGGGLDLHLGMPPLGFNPNMPPPGMPPMGLMATSLPPPGFSMPPPQFQHSRAGFGPSPVGAPAPRSLMAPGGFATVSDDDEERRSSRRKRSRSRSPRRDRDREERRDRDSRRRGDRDSERTSSRRHRSRSTSGERRRRRDDREREKRRERRGEDEDRKKRSRRDDDDDGTSGRRERKEKSSKEKESTRSRTHEDEEATGASGAGNEESPIVD